MYQVFVVEDELLIRQHIRKTVESLGGLFSFCGEAGDGEMALSIMQDLLPDILLTDIRMPFLDGFELIKHAKAIMPWLKVVILSGFDDFEYARKAISLGVNSYLLKPVNASDLSRELNKLAAEIEQEKNTPKIPEGYNEAEIGKVLRQHFVQQVLHGGSATHALLDKASALKVDILRSHYQVALFSFEDLENKRAPLFERVNALLISQGISLYFTGAQSLVILFCDNDEAALSDHVYRIISILKHELQAICPVITVVTSSVAHRLSQVSEVYHTATDLMNKARMVSAGQIIDAGDTAQLAAGYIDFNAPFGEAFRIKMRHASANDLESILDSIISGPNESQFNSVLMRYYALLEIMKVTVKMLCAVSGEHDEKDIAARLSSECDINLASCERESFRPTALRLMQIAVNAKEDRNQNNRHYHVISRAVAYVQANYCDPNITLISVAEHVGMSTAHFSTVFSQTMGRSFIAYLTGLCIEKAKELLAASDMKLSDIAMEIGYNEPNYFSHVFRKNEGLTPKEYRNMKHN